jgi:hypothetical protein
VSIYIKCNKSNTIVTTLAKNSWDLPSQVEELEKWLFGAAQELLPSEYTADIGFSIRENACGGGAIIYQKRCSLWVI